MTSNIIKKPLQHIERNTNLELFRIILMLLIVAHHYVVNSGMMTDMSANLFALNSMFFYLFGAWGKTCINAFVLITGYFMCKSHITLKKFLKLLFEIEFYNLIIYFVFILTGYEKLTVWGVICAVVPVRVIETDFTGAFIIFYLCIPFLNILVKNLNEKMHLRLIGLLIFTYVILGTIPKFTVIMNYVSWFIVIYFIAAYVRIYPKAIFDKTKVWGFITIISLLISILSVVLCLSFSFSDYFFIADSNKILAVVLAFSSFMFFKNVKVKNSKVINIIASASFGVLLIHANSDTMRQWLWSDTLQNAKVFHTNFCYLHFFCSVFGIYIICTCIELIRIDLVEKPFFKWFDKISPKIYNVFQRTENNLLKTFHLN